MPTLCKVTVERLHVRAQATSESALIASYPRGTTLNFVDVVAGEVVAGNPHWGHSEQGHYFWLGGTDHPNGKDTSGGQGRVVGDDYPFRNDPVDTPDGWGFRKRECTSFVAYRMNHQYGVPFTNGMKGGWFGNADTWADNARKIGYRVDNTPAVGSIAMWGPNVWLAGPSGHVALVAVVHPNGTITVEEYNWLDPYPYNYGSRTVPADHPTRYIHVAN